MIRWPSVPGRCSITKVAASATILTAAFALLSHPTLEAQDAVDSNARVARILRGIVDAKSVEAKEAVLSRAVNGTITINNVAQKPKPVITDYANVHGVEVWSKDDGESMLARHGSRWAMKEAGDEWLVVQKPRGADWDTTTLVDPRFLAERLLETDGISWKLEETGEIDSKPVRRYTCAIDGDAARSLARSGALTDAAALSNPLMRIIALRGARLGAAAGRNAEGKIRYEIELFENPKLKLPDRLLVRAYATQSGQGGAQVFVLGGGAPQQDDQDDDGKEKPSATVTIDFTKWNEAERSDRLSHVLEGVFQIEKTERQAEGSDKGERR
ncbi:MAG: hypothetical protein H6832_09030 [Planctomycetes bacterium]|nr:hypothetical protein [Planctomycetota bacterium]MCB9918534.1 hypothetical protein [Planctomycetota bacterium]